MEVKGQLHAWPPYPGKNAPSAHCTKDVIIITELSQLI